MLFSGRWCIRGGTCLAACAIYMDACVDVAYRLMDGVRESVETMRGRGRHVDAVGLVGHDSFPSPPQGCCLS